MNDPTANSERGGFATLRAFVRPRKTPQQAEPERCELCSLKIPEGHPHLLELETRTIVCACEPCAILFSNQAAPRFRRVPRRLARIVDFAMDDHEWDSLLIPVGLAYFFFNSEAKRMVAYYPSPAGATESLLDLEYWSAIAEHNPVLSRLEPDVEALLVRRDASPPEYYVAPIDQCYRLVGLIRQNWRGFSGGPEVRNVLDQFFHELQQQAVEVHSA